MSKVVSSSRQGAVFEADHASRNVTRFLLVLQLTGLLLVVFLRLFGLQLPALIVSLLTLLLFLASLLWLYARYRNSGIIQEKIRLERLHAKFEKSLQREEDVIRAAILERERLVLAEREELELALNAEEKERTGQKYQELQEKNGAAESRARASKELLTRELTSFKPRLEQLAPLSFTQYLSRSLSSDGLAGGMLALLLLGMQIVSSVSAAGSMPTAALAPAAPSLEIVASPAPPTFTDVPAQASTPTASETIPPTALPSDTAEPAATEQVSLPAGLAACIPQNTRRENGLVIGVVDGDTIDVIINGEVQRVRYIGVNTPEQNQPFYQEALALNQSLVLNKSVILVKDTSEVDPYDRLLRYVVVESTFVNEALVESGAAEASAYPPDTACIAVLETAQGQAQTAQVGLWLAPTPALIPPVTGGETAAANCDPSYPGVCIAPAPPDLDCGDITFRRFQVLPSDPHGFDRDQDGVGCE